MSNINPINLAFINKIQHIYSKKASQTSMSSYLNKNQSPQLKLNDTDHFASLNPIKKQHLIQQKKWETVQQELQRLVMPFKENLTQLLQNISDQNKLYKLLQLMRKNQLLSDISQSINEKHIKENFALKKQLQKIKHTLGHFSKTHRQSRSSSQKNPQNAPNPFGSVVQKIDSTRSIPQNIYIQAKLMKEDDFVEWCDKILIKNKIVITDLKRQVTPRKSMLKTHNSFTSHHNRSFSAMQEKDAQIDHPNFYENHLSLVKKIQQLSPLTEIKLFENIKSSILIDIQALKLQKLTCPKFCCSLDNQKLFIESMRTSNSKIFAKSSSRAKSKNQREIYRNDKTQEYFNRYYKNLTFKMDQIKSVEHTKGEQMNRLEDQYHRMLENRSKFRYGY